MKPKITRVTCPAGDWVGLYIDGELIEDGHSIPDWKLLEILQNFELLVYDKIEISNENMEIYGLPSHLDFLSLLEEV